MKASGYLNGVKLVPTFALIAALLLLCDFGAAQQRVTTTGGTANTVPLFTTPTNIQNSAISQSGSGATAKIGIGSTAPATTLDVNGSATVRGNEIVTGSLTANTSISAPNVTATSGFYLGSLLFGYGNATSGNAYTGLSGSGNTQSGTGNTASGYSALAQNAMGSNNTAFGSWALNSNTGDSNSNGYANTAIGTVALYHNTVGNYNTAVGWASLYANIGTSGGGYNTAVGVYSLEVNASGNGNTAIGMQSLGQWGSGNVNTALGYRAGLNTTDQNNSGSGNTFVGSGTTSGTQTTPTNETAIGINAEVDTINAMVLGSISGVNTATANTNVGIGTTTPSFPLHIGNRGGGNSFFRVEGPAQAGTNGLAASFGGYGDFGIDAVGVPEGRFVVKESGAVGIGTAFPDASLTVNGSADKPGGGSWGVFSDLRLKILGGSFDSGLSQILKLHPVRYHYKSDNALGIQDRAEHIGFVAQEVKKVLPEAVSANSQGYLLVNNDPILWTMLNAIKEQQTEIESLRAAASIRSASALDVVSSESAATERICNGNVKTDSRGFATLTLPQDVAVSSLDYRYQLTVVGQFAQAIVARKIDHGRFLIRTNKPNVEVSWQVTAVQHLDRAVTGPLEAESNSLVRIHE